MLTDASVYATIPARDFDRAKHFYKDTLGLQMVEESPEGASFLCGDTQLYVYPTFSEEIAGHTLASWVVADLEAEMADLRDRGITFEEYDLPGFKTEGGIVEAGAERAAWFKDSEGNTLSINERRPR